MTNRARDLAAPVAACVFLLAFYWRGLDCWFYQDDFGWLHYGPGKDLRDWLQIAFAPKAHGNLRPWSENLFFSGLKTLFGVNPLPFRIVVFATMMANVFVLDAVVRRLTGSRAASFATLVCWLGNPAMGAALAWTCIYNQTQYVFFVLLALLLFMQGRRWWSMAVFTLGLGSLELVVMFPAIAGVYAWLWERKKLKWTVPMFAVAAAFVALHFVVAPAPAEGVYAVRADARMATTLWRYWELAIGPERFLHFHWEWPKWTLAAGNVTMSLLLLGLAAAGRRVGAFGLAWFVLLLGPVLTLPDHVMDYLVTGPAIGIALMIGGALATKWRWAGAAAVGLYLAACLPAAWDVMTWNRNRSHLARDLVTGVIEYAKTHPGETLLLTGMSTDQFFAGFADLPFELYGMRNVHLAPGAEKGIEDGGRLAPLYVKRDEGATVLDVSGGRVREVD